MKKIKTKPTLLKWLLIVLGTVIWSLTMVRSGICWDRGCSGGLGFWGPNGHDGIWHIALINSLSQGNSQIPIFSGWSIQNYHIGFDLAASWIIRLTGISASFLYFQILPPLLALLIGILTYKFVYLWRKSHGESLLATFFVYFGGSFGWLISLLRNQGLGGESMFWAQQSISTLLNPPFAMSFATILLALVYLLKYQENKKFTYFILTAILFGLTIGIKVYAGLLSISAIILAGIWIIFKKKDFSIFGLGVVSLTIAAFLFIPFNKNSVGLVVLAPFWFLESMMVLTDRVGWLKFSSAMTTYRMGHIWLKAFLAYGLAFVIFLIGNLGTRFLALRTLCKRHKDFKNINEIEVFILSIIFMGTLVPLLFVQKGTPWNTIQFFYYSLMFSGILSGIVLWNMARKTRGISSILIILTVFLFTIPTTIASLGNFLPAKPQAVLPVDEVEALEFLSDQPDGVVMTFPFDEEASKNAAAPRPLHLYTTTAYVSAYSKKPVFLEDQINLDIMQYPWNARRESVEDFLTTFDIDSARNYLKENNISYVYWLTGQHAREGDKQLGMNRIFENDTVTIFKVDLQK